MWGGGGEAYTETHIYSNNEHFSMTLSSGAGGPMGPSPGKRENAQAAGGGGGYWPATAFKRQTAE